MLDAVVQHPGVIYAGADPRFLVSSEEDVIINWVHDVSDLGWGVKNFHIAQRIKSFLSEESHVVLFGDDEPINFPSASWITGKFKQVTTRLQDYGIFVP